MARYSRRDVLVTVTGLGIVACAGCTSSSEGGSAPTPNPSADCSNPERPNPTSASVSPRDYPEAPAVLTRETVREYVSAFETAYQYNSALADDPGKIGTRNELEISVEETTVESKESDGSDETEFTASVSGNLYYSIATPESAETPTPTVTPLPMGREAFSASYVVTPGAVRREEQVVHCW